MKPDRPPPDHPSYRPDIDGLRAIAILSVLGFHAFPVWVPGGFVGVDIFFVLSGFLISGILLANLRDGHFSIARFYARRVRRIFPALLLVMASVAVAGFFLLWPGEYRYLGKHILGGATFVVNLMMQHETGYFAGSAETKPLLHLWSLGVEEQFYIFWPLMLWAAWKCKHHAGAMIAAAGVASFAANVWLVTHHPYFDFYSLLSRFWELLAGGALAWVAQNGTPRIHSRLTSNAFSAAGTAFLLLAVFALDKDQAFPGWRALLPVGGTCLTIAAGETAFLNRRVLGSRAFVGIGLISYPLYLWHWPLLSFAQILSGQVPQRNIRIMMIALSFVLAVLTYKLVERPIRKRSLGKKRIFVLLGLMAAMGGIGAAIDFGDGLPLRFAEGKVAGEALDGDRLIDIWQHNVRMHECHLQDPEETQRPPQCIEAARPLLMLWGDSHAASLYPGLKRLQEEKKFGIAQMTQAGCPPVFDVPSLAFRKDCNTLNKHALQDATDLQPSVIILAGAWHHHDYPMENADLITRLTKTIAVIKKAAPNAKLIVIGPEPRWLSPLPSIYRRALTFDHRSPPARMTDHLDPQILELDDLMRKALADKGVDYLSPQQQLCDAQGCQTRLGDGFDSLTFIDEEHPTAITSIYLIHQFAPDILDGLGLPAN